MKFRLLVVIYAIGGGGMTSSMQVIEFDSADEANGAAGLINSANLPDTTVVKLFLNPATP